MLRCNSPFHASGLHPQTSGKFGVNYAFLNTGNITFEKKNAFHGIKNLKQTYSLAEILQDCLPCSNVANHA
jgi:hypothetical protein